MKKLKDSALKVEDYHTADSYRKKILGVQEQLMRFEDQFCTELLQNFITIWQTELIQFYIDSLTAGKSVFSLAYPVK
jgi:hypothetical protein